MNKREFLAGLRKGLAGLPQEDMEERLTFYAEMLDDRMEEGLSEEEAVEAVGPIDEIVRQAVADTPLTKIAKERIRPKRRLKAWEIVLLVLGSPIWLPLAIAGAAIILALYMTIWAVLDAFWVIFGALAGCTVGSVFLCVFFALGGNTMSGLAALAAGFVCAGLAIFLFFGCKKMTGGICLLTRDMTLGIKNCFIRKEETA